MDLDSYEPSFATGYGEAFVMMNNGSCIVFSDLPEENKNVTPGKSEFRAMNKYGANLIYPPPKATGIIDIKKSPYEKNLYYVITNEGGMFIYRFDNGTGKILEHYPYDYFVVRARKIGMMT